ncbi:MAG: DNA cytosine methyltransferase, partial [Muribaculaceae bacterium]|nr:DNA cytosine methyltransferase [Muribaculaceae bacterium]
LKETTQKEKHICDLLLKNRRKDIYGPLDGNPLSLNHLIDLDPSICQEDIDNLIRKGILKMEKYLFQFTTGMNNVNIDGMDILKKYSSSILNIDVLKMDKEFKKRKINVSALMEKIEIEGCATCCEVRYDFKNTKISTGLNGVNRIFLPSSKLYPTLVASDTNDYITDVDVQGKTDAEYKHNFLNQVYFPKRYRRITKEEACIIQGFPKDFILPDSRARWMKLIGNSVAVSLISQLIESIIKTGVFEKNDYKNPPNQKRPDKSYTVQLSLF